MTLQQRSRLFQGLAILLCLLCFAWPEAAAPAKSKAHAGERTICVASVIGHKFDVQTIGLMVFGNKLESATIRSWGIDGLVVSNISAALRRRFPVRRISLPPTAVATFVKRGGSYGPLHENMRNALRGSGRGCRFYVLAMPYSGQWSGTNQSINGLGILKHGGIVANYVLFAEFSVQVYDGHSLERIIIPYGGGLFGNPRWRVVKESWWPGSAKAVRGNAKLRTATQALVSKNLTREVPRLLPALNERMQ